ncbi:hypothetical protein E2C01_038930 [Portunus trituberculatus]|uniref:Uncharacterized protein n=1 Tax=Portunus trituberculatus TaxID=210409 RepID=A0A5B7FI76_PORTR|nr:hypothetical protein [Portunus trituberculatus]
MREAEGWRDRRGEEAGRTTTTTTSDQPVSQPAPRQQRGASDTQANQPIRTRHSVTPRRVPAGGAS